MRKIWLFLLSALTVLAFVITPTSAGAAGDPDGLWAGNHQAAETNCEIGIRDGNDFCYYDDNPVGLGVRFTTDTAVDIVGVRIYRVDPGVVTGTLWDSTGQSLATGQFADYAGNHGWQDLIFDVPVSILPETIYTASYYAPNGIYSYQYDFYTSSQTEGPITALAGVNGVYKYDAPAFPTDVPARHSNYWVTPLWAEDPPGITITTPGDGATYLLNQQVAADYACIDDFDPSPSCIGPVADGAFIDTATVGSKDFKVDAEDASGNESTLTNTYSIGYAFSGFLAPVDNPDIVNVGKAGRTYPVKFQLMDADGAYISSLSAVQSITKKSTTCGAFTGDPSDALEVTATGDTSLRYDSTTDQFIYNWKTPSQKGCYTLFVTLDSGQTFPAYFNLK